MYTYRMKDIRLAWALWLVTGIMGGHRLYVGKIATGLLMLATGGGGGVWWLFDAFFVKRMVEARNQKQSERKEQELPPLEMAFMPALPTQQDLEGPPWWAARRQGRVRLMGDALVLIIAGALLGATTVSRGDFEALAAVLALIAITIFGARWDPTLPLLRDLDRWSDRLRLYYRFNDPGGPLSLMFRPILGPLTAWARKRARAEVRLYLQLGAVFTIGFTLLDVLQAMGGGNGFQASAFIGDLFMRGWQANPRWIPSFDDFPLTSVEVKAALFAEAAEDGWTIVLSHEPRQPVGVLRPERSKFRFDPII